MKKYTTLLVIIYIVETAIASNDEISTSTTTPQPPQSLYQPLQQSPLYAHHQSYPQSNGYGGSFLDRFFYPQLVQPRPIQAYQEQKAPPLYPVMPIAEGPLLVTLKFLGKVGLFILGTTALLTLGGIFTLVICQWTPVCAISFPGFGGIDKESVRSLMNPDNLSATAALLQDAIGKYERLQRAIRES